MNMKKEIIGNATLYHGDCLEILPTLEKVDAVVTDPPYGIKTGVKKCGGSKSLEWGEQKWDASICQDAVNTAITCADVSIIWGGNYYDLPPSRCWLAWDKCQPEEWYSTAHFELAWTSMDKNSRAWRMSQVSAYSKMNKQHPSQKPLGLIDWCIKHAEDPKSILDPFMGSGTTGVSCMNLGRKFIGIEIEKKYFDIACERIEQAQKQGRLFA